MVRLKFTKMSGAGNDFIGLYDKLVGIEIKNSLGKNIK